MGEWSYCSTIHDTGRFIPGERAAGGWVGTRAGLDAVEYRKISCPFRELNKAVQPLARLSYPGASMLIESCYEIILLTQIELCY
jgi:hypothetical protein